MILAEIIIDLPAMSASELAAWAAVIGLVLPALAYLAVVLLSLYFVRKTTYWTQQKKVEEAQVKHLGLITMIQNENQQTNLKHHELLGAIKGLTSGMSELSQRVHTNNEVTQKLNVQMAVIETVQKEREKE